MQMQALPSDCSLYSYFLLPCTLPYFNFHALSNQPTPPPTSTQPPIGPSYFYSSQIDAVCLTQEQIRPSLDSTLSLTQNRDMSEGENQTNSDGLLADRSEPHHYSPVVLAFNGDSTSVAHKSEEFSTGNPVGNKKQNKRQGKGKAKKEVDEDREYNPQADRRRKPSNKYQENQNRNIIPNEINQIFSFLQKKGKSGVIAQKLFDKFPHPSTYTLKRYYLYQSLLKNKLGHYTNEKSLRIVTELYEPKCQNWPEQEQRYYNKISRVLIRHFLHEDSIFMILTSKRMKSDKKADHIRARRHVTEAVLSILRGC